MKQAITRARTGLIGGMVLGLGAISPMALAQANRSATEEPGGGLAEIVVTAQKRAQSQQDVPIALTAITGDALQVNRIVSVSDLNALTPNMTVRWSAGGSAIPQFSMRGVVSRGGAPGSEKSISLYLDGVFLGATRGSIFDLPDVERIEVLRGPQGTLFGRNSTGGAISVVTREPSGRFGIDQTLTLGNYDQIRSKTRIELLQMGPFSASISYVHDERSGDIRNLGAGQHWDRTGSDAYDKVQTSPKTLGAKNTESLFAALKFEPSDHFKAVYKFDWLEGEGTPEGMALVAFTPTALGSSFGALLNAIYAANPVPIAGAHRPKAVNNSWTTSSFQRASGHNLTMTYQPADGITIKNVFGYRKSFIYAVSQISGMGGLTNVVPALGPVGAPYIVTETQGQNSGKQWSDELQINYDSRLLTLTAGGLLYHLDTVFGAPLGLANNPAFAVIPNGKLPIITAQDRSFNEAKSKAAYLQAELHATPQLDIVLGGRITRDDKSGTTYVGGNPISFDYSKSKPTYLAGVNYRPARDMLLYAKYSTGFVSGGAVGPIIFNQETVRSWEAGLKSDLLDRHLRLNLALFAASYKSLQNGTSGRAINRPELGNIIVDEGDAKTKGFEVEFTALPLPGFTINGGVGYTDFHYTRVNPIYGTTQSFLPTFRPKWTTNLAAQYETGPLFDDARLAFNLSGNWQSRMRTYGINPVPTAYRVIQFAPPSLTLNGRIALKGIHVGHADGEVALWGRNLTDSDHILFPIAFSMPPYLASTAYEAARTFGIDFSIKY
ncbi:MAG TPA: TonB-dependent receptor [Sphingobium sp.]|nr:TonB-dependent receptor [Sphingobium sp.]